MNHQGLIQHSGWVSALNLDPFPDHLLFFSPNSQSFFTEGVCLKLLQKHRLTAMYLPQTLCTGWWKCLKFTVGGHICMYVCMYFVYWISMWVNVLVNDLQMNIEIPQDLPYAAKRTVRLWNKYANMFLLSWWIELLHLTTRWH